MSKKSLDTDTVSKGMSADFPYKRKANKQKTPKINFFASINLSG